MSCQRSVRTVGLVAVAALLAACASSGVPDLMVSGSPRPLPPADGGVHEVSWSTFQDIVAGQSGHVVVVNVWASWCTPCRAEAPEVARLAAAIAPEAVMVGLVAQDSPANAREFIGEFSLRFPNLLDMTGEITERLQMRGFPTTYVFDPDGRLSTLMFGGVTEQRLAAAIRDARA